VIQKNLLNFPVYQVFYMSNNICIVGKGESLLSKTLGQAIDQHDKIIRVNNLPDFSNKTNIGTKTTIFSTRCKIKLHKHIKIIPSDCKNLWVCLEKEKNNVSDICSENNNLKPNYITEEELNYIRLKFPNFLNLLLLRDDKTRGFCMPDTGITTILLAIIRFPENVINVCGFDLYKFNNKNIYETKSNASLFLTPVLQQIIIYKNLIKNKIINELI